ncbi:MAG: beta-N-acetylhexosaminidase [Actinobacteria bacterium]|nr:MAG: beta-N-acetylhexosaminidase [Actinomycetota bacterium]
MPGKLTFWRRRITALLVVAGIAVAIWVALADGTTKQRHSRADGLSTAELAGQRLITGFHGGSPPHQVKRLIGQGRLAGVILFDDNLGSTRHNRRLIRRLQAIKRPQGLRNPLLIMIDQEGGLVKRLSGPPNASAEEMGQRGRRYSRRQGVRTAENLKGVGINVNLAPVLDVGRPGSAITAEHRSFGSRPERVIRTAIPFATGMQDHGVAATGKHFPGLGAAKGNTDNGVQKIHLPRAKLRRVDEKPYGPFSSDGGDMVMISTAVYTDFSHRPAIATKRIATGELRRRVGFKGVSVTDALETPSVNHFDGAVSVGVDAAKAGTDLLLYTRKGHAARAWHELQGRLAAGKLNRPAFERSVNRVLSLSAKLGG